MGSSPEKPISEAPESNAGDDFHRLWAAKRALDLVNFDDNGLKMLSIEGSQPDEAREIDPTGQKLLSIDLAEYYGGRTFASASRVVFSQLKYSTRSPDKNYTVARLCEGKGDDKDRSIIERLADSFNGYRTKYGRDDAIRKLTIKLVTNRPVENSFKQQLKQIQNYLSDLPDPVNYKKLLAEFPDDEDMLTRLFKAANLKSQEFTDFLRTLDFGDTGTESRFFQRSKLIQKLSEADPNEFKVRFNALYVLVNDLTMPERRDNNALTIEDIVLLFEMGRIENMFPAPPMLEKLPHPVKREQVSDLKNEIVHSAETVICLHGEGGTGKSTIVQQLLQELPAGSLAICYDCYGQGTYLNSEANRHLPQVAFTEIINELAKETGTPFLLNPDLPDYMFPRHFSDKINAAADLINASYPEAILALVIDAADNSVTAAALRNHACFIEDLVTLGSFRPSFRLIFTCRTARINSLKLPESYKDIPIKPFSEPETKLFVSDRLGEFREEELKEFHELTGGIPRVQSYSLLNRNTITAVFEFLKPYGHSVGTLIDSHLKESKIKFGNTVIADDILKGLITLPRPVPIRYVSILTGVSEHDISDFIKDLWTGLVLTDNRVSFRDEDFEDRLRDAYPASVSYYEKVSDLMSCQADNDAYAAANLAGFLFHAERFRELKEVVLLNKYLEIKDPIYKRDIFIERTRLAIRSCDIQEDNATFVRLMVIAAEAAKSNKTQLGIIYNHVELIVENNNLRTIQKLYYDVTSNDGYGAANWRVAAIFSRKAYSAGYARQHLYQAEKWLRRRAKFKEHSRERYPINETDIASGAESVLLLDGIDYAIKWLKRWQPKEMMTKVIRSMVRQTLIRADEEQVANWIIGVKRTDAMIILAAGLIQSGRTNYIDPTELFKRIQWMIDRSFRFADTLNKELIFLAEFYIGQSEHRSACSSILKWLNISVPGYNTRFMGGEYGGSNEVTELDHYFRVRTLLAQVDNHELLPSELIPPEKLPEDRSGGKPRRSSESEALGKLYKHLLPVYKLRAAAAMKPITENAGAKLTKVFSDLGNDWIFLYERGIDANHLLMHISKVLMSSIYFIKDKKDALSALRPISEHGKIFKQRFLLDLAYQAARFKEGQILAYELMSEAETFINENDLSASERVNFYEECIAAAQLMQDQEEALIYFNKAMSAASEVDLEAFDQIRAVRSLAAALGENTRNPQLAYDLSRYTEYSSIILSGNDGFPWMQAVWAIAKIDPASLLSIWCRWDQQDRSVDSDAKFSFWSSQLCGSLLRREISALQAAAMSAFYPLDYDWEMLWESIITNAAEKGPDAVRKAVGFLTQSLRFSEISSRSVYAAKIKALFERTGVPHLLPEYIKKLMLFRPDSPQEDSEKNERVQSANDESGTASNEALTKAVQETDPTDGSAIGFALQAIMLTSDGSGPLYTAELFLAAIMEKTLPAQYTAQLDALLSLNESHLSYYAYREALEERVAKWGHKQTVKLWVKENFDRVIANHFLFIKNKFEVHDYLDVSGLHKLRELFSMTASDLAVSLKKVIPVIIDILPAPVIYQCFTVLQHLLSSRDAEDTIQWMVARWCRSIPADTGEGVWTPKHLPPDDAAINYAGFIRYHLGHPDTAIRWTAAHMLVNLAETGDSAIFSAVCGSINERTAWPFTHTALPFLWISAKLWLYYTLDLLAARNAEAVVFQLPMIKADLFQESGQHLLIRKLALSITVSALHMRPDLFTAAETEKISEISDLPARSLSTPNDPEDLDEEWEEPADEIKRRFPFDTLDTVPDYYDPLARIFKTDPKDIYTASERAIFEILGYQGDIQKADYIAQQQHRIRDRGSSLPTLETLKDYYEFHGLFFAADQLFREGRAADDGYYSLDEWMTNWSTSWPGTWLSELRDDTPLEKRLWESGVTYLPGWRYAISAAALDEATGLNRFYESELVIIDHHDSKCFEGGMEMCGVSSALVSQENAPALMNAFQTIDNFNRFKLPVENEDWEDQPLKKFSLIPMVANQDPAAAGVDLLDYSSLSLAQVKRLPCSRFLTFYNAAISADGRDIFKNDEPGKIIGRFQNWTDFNADYNHQPSIGTNGYRLSINKTELMRFLAEIGHCLLVESRLSRDFSRTSYDEKEEFDRQIHNVYTRFYLIYPDGRIITTAGDFNARKKNS